jgi:beta-lactamase superfamily II metal-dependent hydrolase
VLRAVALVIAAAALLSGGAQAQQPDSAHLELRFIDVGQGDAALLRLGHQAVLIDAGRGDDIVLVLEELGVDSLLAAVASHNHDDHIGGMDAVLYRRAVGTYFWNGRRATNQNGRNVEELLETQGIVTRRPACDTVLLGDTRIILFASPLDERASENNSSLGVIVERGDFRALLTGDSELQEISAWLKAGVIPRVDVLKAAHHGARNGVTPGWLLATDPAVVVISVGGRNAFGHPDPWALRYYSLKDRKVYRTDADGTVVVTVDGAGGYSVQSLGATER